MDVSNNRMGTLLLSMSVLVIECRHFPTSPAQGMRDAPSSPEAKCTLLKHIAQDM